MTIAGRRAVAGGLLACLLIVAAACAGPDTGDDHDPTPTATASPTATTAPTATSEPTPTATIPPTVAPTEPVAPTAVASPSGTAAAQTPSSTTTADAQSTASGTPAADGTTTPGVNRTPIAPAESVVGRLPTLEQLPAPQYVIAITGSRTAQELANAYADPVAHLRRLDEWGFVQHVYREFSPTADAPDSAPDLVLTTINVYGSPEQAQAALEWLNRFQTSIGAAEATLPARGDAAVALTVNTADGIPTASIYVRVGEAVHAFYAEGGDALAFASALVEAAIPAN